MGKEVEQLPPFLAKLLLLTKDTLPETARWSKDGSVYVVVNDDLFQRTLKKYFKGSKQTFIRQLHFYGFKKIDTSEGSWGFIHENGLFVKGNTDLVKDIRRKKKVDPDTQKIATYYEVQALKNQITFLQDIVESLRLQVTKLKQAKAAGNKNVDVKIEPKEVYSSGLVKEQETKKRQRKENDQDIGLKFEEMCDRINPPATENFARMPSMTPSDLLDMDMNIDLDTFSGLFSDLDLEPIESIQVKENEKLLPAMKADTGSFEFDSAVDAIAEATKVKKSDVSKIIDFLSKLSVTEQQNLEVGKQTSSIFTKHLTTPRVQKVGAS